MKYALVTGSTKGIGFAIAKELIGRGFFVFINYAHDEPQLEIPPECHAVIRADLSMFEGVKRLISVVLQKTDKLDALVLNTGTTCRKPFSEVEYDDWQQVMDTNLNMPFFLVQGLAEHIADEGAIVFISSLLSQRPHATSIPYGVSKAAVNMLAQSLVKELAPRKIRVNAICPGFIDTLWQKEKPRLLREKIESKIALGRFGQPEEAAQLCVDIIENGYINGSVINIDGGYDFM